MKYIAITGGIACGKSTLGRLLAEQGADVLDADAVVHRLQAPGGALVEPLRAEFGNGVITPDGAIDRHALATLVFATINSPPAVGGRDSAGVVSNSSFFIPNSSLKGGVPLPPLARLNAIVHPVVREEFKKWRDDSSAKQPPWAKVAIIPLLFESGWQDDWDVTLCITCSPEAQLRRALARGWTQEELARRAAAQWPMERKRALATIAVDNSTDDLHALAQVARDLRSYPFPSFS